ncbi:hypothetical protein D3C87_1857920 [compost metagenome]
MAVEGADAHPCLVGDLAHRRIDARGGKYIQGGFQQQIEVAPRIRPHRPVMAAISLMRFARAVRPAGHINTSCKAEHCSV